MMIFQGWHHYFAHYIPICFLNSFVVNGRTIILPIISLKTFDSLNYLHFNTL